MFFPHARPRLAPFALGLLFATATTLGAVACAGDGPTGPPDPPVVASVQVSPGGDTLIAIGRTRVFTAVAREADGTAIPGAVIRWRSSDTLVARVDSLTGVVTAVNNGGATITARSGIVTGTGTVSVIQFVAAVQVTPGTSGLAAIGATQAYTAVARDSANAVVAGVRFLWISSNPAVATIDTNGVATAVGAGTTTISASGRGVPAYSTLTVTQASAAVTFTIEPTTVRAGIAFPTALQVEVRDAGGNLVRDSRIPVTVAIAVGPGGATVNGSQTVNAVGGIATFSGLWLPLAASGYRLRATAAALAPDTSAAFAVLPGLPTRIQLTEQPTGDVDATDGAAAASVAFFDAFGNAADTTFATTLSVEGRYGVYYELSYDAPVATAANTLRFTSLRFTRADVLTLRAAAAGGASELAVRSSAFRTRTPFGQLSLGSTHACGRTGSSVLCWGNNTDGRLLSRDKDIALVDSIPGVIASDEAFIQVLAGASRTCALTASGVVRCWGAGGERVIPGTGSGALIMTQISGKDAHMCGVTTLQRVHCWGEGSEGQLGDGGSVDSDDPVLVSGAVDFTAVTAGLSHSCALAVDGAVWCWGWNDYGQLGDSTRNTSSVPVRTAATNTGPRLFRSISAGGHRTCAIDVDEEVFCWGELAGSGGSDAVAPVRTLRNDDSGWRQVVVGATHTCALAYSNAVRCWGSNASGQLGTFVGPSTPFPYLMDFALAGDLFEIDAGLHTTCVRSAAAISCVGSNVSGVMGIGTMALGPYRTETRTIH